MKKWFIHVQYCVSSDIWKQEKIGNYYLKYCKRSRDMQLERFKPTNEVGRNLSPQCSVQEFTSQEAIKHFMMLDSTVYLVISGNKRKWGITI